MAREAAKSKALQPRGMIQSRLEKQKAKAKDMEATHKIEEPELSINDRKQVGDNIDVPLESSAMVQDNKIDKAINSPAVVKSTAEDDPTESNNVPVPKRRGRGRPSNGVVRTALTLRPNSETVKRLRVYAAENRYGMSDVVDILVELFLDSESLAEQLSNLKAKRKL